MDKINIKRQTEVVNVFKLKCGPAPTVCYEIIMRARCDGQCKCQVKMMKFL